MKKALSIVLSLVMLLSVTAGLSMDAYANSVCIDVVNIYNVTEPVAGNSPDYDYQMYDIDEPYSNYMSPLVFDNMYYHNGIAWMDKTKNEWLYYDDGSKFEEGHTYIVYISIKCTGLEDYNELRNETSRFDDHNYITATINGVQGEAAGCVFVTPQEYTCTVSAEFTAGEEHAHDYQLTAVDQATLNKAGSKTYTCSCGDSYSKKIPAVGSIKLSKTSYVYDGKVKTPKIIVTDSRGKEIDNKFFFFGMDDGRKNVGTYSVEIILNGNYYGVFAREFKIVPKGTTISKVTSPKKKQLKVTWSKQATQTTGYQIQYSTSSKFTAKTTKSAWVNKNTTNAKTIGKLKSGKKYYVRIRTYKNKNNQKYYSSWSKTKSIKVK